MTLRYALALASALSIANVVQSAAVARDDTSPLYIPKITTDPSRFIDPDFPGLAFEQASFVNYALNSDGTPNVFSHNLVDAIFARTGGKPLIRLGGTSGDYAKYLANQTEPALPRAEVDNFQNIGGTTIGPSYWAIAAKSFPSGQYIVQIPMATPDMEEAVRWAKAATASIGADRIHSYEPGNEPDLYPAQGLGPPNWQGRQDNGTYVSNFVNYCDRVAAVLGLPRGTRRFQALDTASHPADPQQDVFSLSLRSLMEGGLDGHYAVKTVARHYYQTDGGGAADLARGLMNHAAITARLDVYRSDLEFLAGRTTKIPYVLSEVGNSLNRKHDYAYQATLGSALWQVDFQLYALSLGVARFNFQQIMHSGFNLWLPGASGGMPPQVFANYYAQPFVADFVGSAGTVQVKNVPLEPNVAAYVAYEVGAPKRVAIVNLNYWSKCLSKKGEQRLAQHVRLQTPPGVTKVRVVHLTSPNGASAKAKTITYAGSQWTYESLGKEVTGVRNDGDVLAVNGGTVEIPVKASEAVIVHFI
ncbi:hypothetical protein PWT90_00588 [Aphanocladium album]|nr:hypothetical protein PWT90_00588 [Aphanocladium album]